MPAFSTNDPNQVIPTNREATRNTIRGWPQNIVHRMNFSFSEYSFAGAQGGALGESTGSVFLPIPANLSEAVTIQSKATSLGVTGSGLADIMSGSYSAGGIADSFYNMAMNSGGNLLEALGGNMAGLNEQFSSMSSYAKLLARGGLPENLSAAIDVTQGTAVNPYNTVDFDGVALKQHSFNWQLSPSSEAESNEIRDIITKFKRNALPEFEAALEGTGSNTLSRALLKYPSLVTISLEGVDESYYPTFKPALITNITVRYNEGAHLMVYKGGAPVAIDLTIELLETDIHTKADY